MTHDELLRESLPALFKELTHGAAADAAWVLNPGDRGLLKSLDALSATEASAQPRGRSSIAAHVDHVRYGLELLNRWASGEPNPFATADYAASWKRQTVAESQWTELREALAREAGAWEMALAQPREPDRMALMGMISSVVHLAYHVGAIRQIDAAAAGPRA